VSRQSEPVHFKVNKTALGYLKCRRCGTQKSLLRLRWEIAILTGFYQRQPAYRLASDLQADVKVVPREAAGHY
jgi:hypothetical protein